MRSAGDAIHYHYRAQLPHVSTNVQNSQKLMKRKILNDLPSFCYYSIHTSNQIDKTFFCLSQTFFYQAFFPSRQGFLYNEFIHLQTIVDPLLSLSVSLIFIPEARKQSYEVSQLWFPLHLPSRKPTWYKNERSELKYSIQISARKCKLDPKLNFNQSYNQKAFSLRSCKSEQQQRKKLANVPEHQYFLRSEAIQRSLIKYYGTKQNLAMA